MYLVSMSYLGTLATSPRIEEVDFLDAPPPSRFTQPAYPRRLSQKYTTQFEYHMTPPILDHAI